MLLRVNKIQPSQSNWNFPDFPPVPLSKPELLKLTMIMKIEMYYLTRRQRCQFLPWSKKKNFFPTHIAGWSSRSLHGVTTHVRPQVAQARNISIGDKRHCCVTFNLRSGSIFVSLWKLHSGGQDETKREAERNVCRPLFWLIDICRINQSELLPLLVFLVCKIFTRGKNADWLT